RRGIGSRGQRGAKLGNRVHFHQRPYLRAQRIHLSFELLQPLVASAMGLPIGVGVFSSPSVEGVQARRNEAGILEQTVERQEGQQRLSVELQGVVNGTCPCEIIAGAAEIKRPGTQLASLRVLGERRLE